MVLQSNIRVTAERSLQEGRDFEPNDGQEEKQKEELSHSERRKVFQSQYKT